MYKNVDIANYNQKKYTKQLINLGYKGFKYLNHISDIPTGPNCDCTSEKFLHQPMRKRTETIAFLVSIAKERGGLQSQTFDYSCVIYEMQDSKTKPAFREKLI